MNDPIAYSQVKDTIVPIPQSEIQAGIAACVLIDGIVYPVTIVSSRYNRSQYVVLCRLLRSGMEHEFPITQLYFGV